MKSKEELNALKARRKKMKTKEELNALKAEVETAKGKLRELTDEELEQVIGGCTFSYGESKNDTCANNVTPI